jgi:hypothetical protein
LEKSQAIDEKIRELSNCHLVYQGLDIPKAHSFPLFNPTLLISVPGKYSVFGKRLI